MPGVAPEWGRPLPGLENSGPKALERLVHPVRIHQYFAGFAGLQAGHGLGEILHRDAVGDYGMKIEASTF